MSYNVKKIKNGQMLDVRTGGKLLANGTQASHIADASVDYGTGDLDAEAEIIAAINAANAKLNSILLALEGVGVVASS